MRIGIDIDNVISKFDEGLLNEFLIHDKKLRNTGIIDKTKYIKKGMFDWSQEEINTFYHDNIERIAQNLDVVEDVSKYTKMLMDEGHQIYIISGRENGEYTNPYKLTQDWLEKHYIAYDKLILTDAYNPIEKAKMCVENGIDLMIDDSKKVYREVEKTGITSLLMETPYNKDTEEYRRIHSWNEIYDFIHQHQTDKEHIILDTDMYNEIDDQFALTYLMKSIDRFELDAITIAPFSKSGYANTSTIQEGTEKSYDTTLHLLKLLNKEEYIGKVYKGATSYFQDSKEENESVDKIIEIALKNEKTTILAIGAITNIALAITKEPKIIDRIKVIWLGGNSFLTKNNNEFNFRQDIKAVQTVFESQVKLVVIPCRNVASNLSTTIYELEHYLKEDNELNQYLLEIFESCKKSFIKSPEDEIGSSKTLWDLSAVAYAINKDWFRCELISCPRVLDSGLYEQTVDRHSVIFVNDLFRNKIYQDFFVKMNDFGGKNETNK